MISARSTALFHHDDALSVLPAHGRFAILSCMDASVDAAKLRGLPGSEAHVIRNAGALATEDAIHSLVLAHRLFGARALFVVHHDGCGMALLGEEITGKLWAKAAHPRDDAGRHTGHTGHTRHTLSDRRGVLGSVALASPAERVSAEVERIRCHPDVPAELPARGFVFHADSGCFYEVS